jgi:uncharacterized membrane protein YvlD (DUF360 family)
MRATLRGGPAMLFLLIGILITIVIGAICFWLIEKFVRDARLANLLKILVVLVCLASILQRLLPMMGINWI